MLGKMGSYSTATLCSMVLHGGLVVMLIGNWVPDETERKFIPPKYIDAKLLQLKAAEKPKPKKDNSATKEKAVAEAKKRAEAKKSAEARKRAEAKKKADARKKADAKQKEEARKKEQARKAAEEKKRKMLEDEFFSELDADLEAQIAENDEQIAGAYSGIISQQVSGNWSRPPSARRNMEVELLIQLVPTGRVVGVSIAKSSGNAAFDRSAEQAVLKAGNFPELKNIEARVFEKYFRNFRMVFRPEDLRL